MTQNYTIVENKLMEWIETQTKTRKRVMLELHNTNVPLEKLATDIYMTCNIDMCKKYLELMDKYGK